MRGPLETLPQFHASCVWSVHRPLLPRDCIQAMISCQCPFVSTHSPRARRDPPSQDWACKRRIRGGAARPEGMPGRCRDPGRGQSFLPVAIVSACQEPGLKHRWDNAKIYLTKMCLLHKQRIHEPLFVYGAILASSVVTTGKHEEGISRVKLGINNL